MKARTFRAADTDDPWTLTDPRGLRWDLYVTGHLNRKTEQLESVYNPKFPESSRYGRVHERAGESNSAFPKSRDHVHTWPAHVIKPEASVCHLWKWLWRDAFFFLNCSSQSDRKYCHHKSQNRKCNKKKKLNKCLYTYPPETQLWSFCLCSGHYIWVYFSETSHVTVIGLDVLYRAHSGLHRDTKWLEVSPWPLPLLGL